MLTYDAVSPYVHVYPGDTLTATDQWPNKRVAQFGYDPYTHNYYLAGIRHAGAWVYVDSRNKE